MGVPEVRNAKGGWEGASCTLSPVPRPMPDYFIFGSCLRSELVFPELGTATNAAPRWTLQVSHQRHPPAGTTLLGTDDIGDGAAVRLYKLPAGYLLDYDDDTGSFEVSADGGLITWFPVPDPNTVMVRMHVIGRVLATALHAAGLFCLHGSGVVVEGVAIGFLAPRFWGKSTLAMALARAGARLLSDDTLALHPDDVVVKLWPGVHSMRLWGDSAERIAGADPAAGAPPFQVKRTFSRLPEHLLAREPVPVSALYLLAPNRGTGPVAQREALAPVPAAAALVGHTKIGALLGKSEAPVVFDRAVRIASRVPVYRLDLVRDFAQLSAVVTQLIAWHRGTTARERSLV